MNIPTVDSPASVKRETYGGTLTIATDTGPEQDRAMILNLEFRGPRITGSASIAGFDPFNVNGKVLTRGIELGLRNSKYFIRLSGGRRDRVLRGTYFLPALNQSGAWTVSRTN